MSDLPGLSRIELTAAHSRAPEGVITITEEIELDLLKLALRAGAAAASLPVAPITKVGVR